MSILHDRETAALIFEYIDEELLEATLVDSREAEIKAGILSIIEREPPDPPGWEGGFADNH